MIFKDLFTYFFLELRLKIRPMCNFEILRTFPEICNFFNVFYLIIHLPKGSNTKIGILSYLCMKLDALKMVCKPACEIGFFNELHDQSEVSA